MSLRKALSAVFGVAIATASSAGCTRDLPPVVPVSHVDISRFMGDWYVIASIPTRFEKTSYNAVETYAMQADGSIDTRFRFRKGGFGEPVKTIKSTGYVKAGTGNAVWGIKIFGPLKAQYLVAYLKDDYSQTIVARDARDYTWIMARTPTISPADYAALLGRVKALGYSVDDVRKTPQRWPEQGP